MWCSSYWVVSIVTFFGLVICEERTAKLSSLQIGIKKRIARENCPYVVEKFDEVEVTYQGMLYKDNTEFDSNVGRDPFKVTVGTGQVIKGWDQGLIGMCEGEKRRLLIPADLGYGSAGSPPKIPPDSDLIFDVELIKIHKFSKEL
ncbi:unnamed protein product [Schistocephalus solidus]|uniref:peptidylprolyl isomerase n=1 Tax=Schistocephalus solidus TaxID=70667 RepID=A0A0X3PDU5_SCHSO|nr:unnamed protein product [Schistocephalus solidus]